MEFNQLTMAHIEGSNAILNHKMLKDNIGVTALLEVKTLSPPYAQPACLGSQCSHPLGPSLMGQMQCAKCLYYKT